MYLLLSSEISLVIMNICYLPFNLLLVFFFIYFCLNMKFKCLCRLPAPLVAIRHSHIFWKHAIPNTTHVIEAKPKIMQTNPKSSEIETFVLIFLHLVTVIAILMSITAVFCLHEFYFL